MLETFHKKYRAVKRFNYLLTNFKNGMDIFQALRHHEDLPPFQLKNGYKISHNPGDDPLGVFHENFIDDCYLKEFYRPKKGDVVFDIGANVGFFTTRVLKEQKDVTVHCFEPTSMARVQLEKNVKENSFGNVTIHPVGVMDKSCQIKILKSDESGHQSIVPSKFVKEDTFEMIDCISLQEAIEKSGVQKIDFLKVDVEGAEVEIFEGARKEDLALVEKVAIEYHNLFRPRAKEIVTKVLLDAGFEIFEIWRDPHCEGLGLVKALRPQA